MRFIGKRTDGGSKRNEALSCASRWSGEPQLAIRRLRADGTGMMSGGMSAIGTELNRQTLRRLV